MSAKAATSCLWKQFVCSRSQLCIDTVLAAGQSFRWRKNSSGEWVGVMAGLVWKLKQMDERILYQVHGPETSSCGTDNYSARFPPISDSNQHDIELKDASTSSTVKQESANSKVKLPSASSQVKTEVKLVGSCNNVSYGDSLPAVKLECFEDNEGMGLLKGEKLQDEGIRLMKCDKLQFEEINNHKSQLQKRHTNSTRKSKRVIERMTVVKPNDWDKNNNTSVPYVKASARNALGITRSTVEAQVSKKTCAAEQVQHSPYLNTEDVDKTGSDDLHHRLLEDYFQTSVDLDCLYKYWSSKDAHFEKVGKNFQGVRLLRLDPTECLLSFVCSSNNHISRISSMVEKLCTHYGKHITSVDGVAYYTFPHLSDLCGDGVESHLRELGFGYRAKFIASIAKHVTQEKGENWLESLREGPYLKAKVELMTLLGVGAKVADCVCLMSLDKPEAMPVDTHVWQFTARNYMSRLHSAKSLTDKLYTEIGDFYRNLWGPYAGWAQAVLFAADLRHNKDRSEGKEDSSNKRKACGDPGSQVLQTSKTKRKENPKPAGRGNRTKSQ